MSAAGGPVAQQRGLTLVFSLLQQSACPDAMSSMGFVTSQGNASKFAKAAFPVRWSLYSECVCKLSRRPFVKLV